MRYNKICLRNYAQYSDFTCDITGNVTALIGRNGAGKSNLLMALKDGLTGEFSRNKERLVTWGQESGFMEFDIEFSPGNRAILRRELPSGKATLKFENEDVIKGANKVNERILAELGVEKAILMNVVFVGQKEIETLLFSSNTTAKDRLAQKFFGIDRANEIESVLAKEINRITFDSSDRHLQGTRDIRKQTIEKLAIKREEHDRFVPVPSQAVIDGLQERVLVATQQASWVTSMNAVKSTCDRLTAEHESLFHACSDSEVSLNKIDPAQIDSLYELHLSNQTKNSNIDMLDASLKRATDALDKLGPCQVELKQLEETHARIEPLQKKYDLKYESIRQKDSILKGMLNTPICPTCTQPIDLSNRLQIEAAREAEVQELTAIDTELKPLKEWYASASSWHQEWKRSHDRLESAKKTAAEARAALGERHTPEPDPNKFLAMRRNYDALKQNLDNQKQTLKTVEINLQAAQQSLATYQAQAINPATIEDVSALQAQITTERERLRHWCSIDAEITGLSRDLKIAEERIAEMEKVEVENRINLRYQRALVRLREVFHPDGAPKILVSRRAKKLEERINQFLALLDTPFTATTREGLDFNYTFPKGIANGEDLSVGQQVDMSWAFRLAANETFSSSVGLMTMDEPTAPLDKETKLHFAELIERLVEMASAYGMQFFISTHDPELVRACDQVIQL